MVTLSSASVEIISSTGATLRYLENLCLSSSCTVISTMPEGSHFVHAPHFPNKYNIPPGDIPDYIYIRRVVISATTLLIVFSTVTTFARFAVRKWTKQSAKADDWFMLAALVSSYIAEVGQFLGMLLAHCTSIEASAHANELSCRPQIWFRKA